MSRLFILIAIVPFLIAPSRVFSAEPGPAAEHPDPTTSGDIFEIFDEQKQVDVVYSATLTKQSTDQAPSQIVVLKEADLARYHFRTLAEALNFVAGIDVISDNSYYDVGVRGLFGDMNANGSSIKVLVDGVDTVFRSTGYNAFGYDQIPIAAISRIEIIRGPMSVVYGANAFLGVINVITRANTKTGGGVSIEGQTLAKNGQITASGNGEYVAKKGFVGGSVGYQYEDESGLVLPTQSFVYSQPRFTDDPTARVSRNDFGKRLAANLHGGYTFSDALTLRADTNLSYVSASAQYQPYSLLYPQNKISTLRGGGTLTLDYTWTWLTVEGKAWTNIGDTLPDARIDLGITDFTLRREVGYESYGGSARVAVAPVKWISGWVLGEFDLDNEHLNLVQAVPRGAPLNQASTLQPATTIPLISNIAVSAQTQINPIEAIGITLGGRVDEHSIYGANESFRAGVVGALPQIGYAKLLAGRAFKAPTPQQLYWQPVGIADFRGDAGLKPQTVNTLELVLGSRALKVVDLQATGFINLVSNRVIYIQQSGLFQAEGIADSTTYGLEFEASLPQLSLAHDQLRLYGALGLTYQHTNSELNELLQSLLTAQNVLFPDYKGTLLASFEVRPAYLALTARLNLSSSRLTSQTNIQVSGGQLTSLPGNRQFDLGLRTVAFENFSSPILKTLSVQFMVRNVLGANVPFPGYNGFEIPGVPRTYELQLKCQY